MSDDSDSPLSDAKDTLPPDSDIERALREIVIKTFKNADFEQLTLKRVRAAVTKDLELPDGFLKTDSKWSSKSKEIVNNQVAKCESNEAQEEPSKTKAPQHSPVQKSPKRKAAAEPLPARKKRKQALPASSDVEEEETEDKAPKKAQTSPRSKPTPSNSKTTPTKPKATPNKPKEVIAELGPDSELSDVIDDSPPPKAKRKKRDTSSSRASKPPKSKPSTASKPKRESAPANVSPEEEEVKRLQGQLGKCGIRRLWGKDLAKFETTSEKISHLKGMLRDVGMTGRFSEEKARQIKEERELKADLEAIQEGEERWGKGVEEGSRRPMARGLIELQGLIDDDEESD